LAHLALTLPKTQSEKLQLNERLREQRSTLFTQIKAELEQLVAKPKKLVQPKSFPLVGKLLGKRKMVFTNDNSNLFSRLKGGKK